MSDPIGNADYLIYPLKSIDVQPPKGSHTPSPSMADMEGLSEAS